MLLAQTPVCSPSGNICPSCIPTPVGSCPRGIRGGDAWTGAVFLLRAFYSIVMHVRHVKSALLHRRVRHVWSAQQRHLTLQATLTYNVHPPPDKLNGVAVSPDSPGIPPFAFHAQHGSWPSNLGAEAVTGFEACTTTVVDVKVQNGRAAAIPPSLEMHGFELASDGSSIRHVEEHAQLRDDGYVRDVYYREAERLALRLLPDATFAKAFNHIRRRNRPTPSDGATSPTTPRHSANLSAPSYMVHADSADASWIPHVRELVRAGDFDRLGPTALRAGETSATLAASDRIVVLNLWRCVCRRSNAEEPLSVAEDAMHRYPRSNAEETLDLCHTHGCSRPVLEASSRCTGW